MLAETDLEIINALQVNPRATWQEVGRVLGLDATTVARRWARLRDDGAAWVSCQPLFRSEPALAFVEIAARPGKILQVAETLARDPEAMTVDISAGARDVLVTVSCADATHLSWYLLERLGAVTGTASVRSHLIVRAYTEASRWRLRSLTSEQSQQLLPKRVAEPAAVVLQESDAEIVAALSADGRAPVKEVARAVGASESTVRRRLGRLVEAGLVRLRCELARELTGWPVSAWFFARVPPDRLDAAATALGRLPEVRAVLSAAGPYNLLLAVWLRSVRDGQRLETQAMQQLPYVELVDRSVVIRPYKLAGRLLDPRGYSVGTVPLAFGEWAASPRG